MNYLKYKNKCSYNYSNLYYEDKTEKKLIFQQNINNLDNDTKKIINLILKDNLCFFKNRKLTKSTIKKELIHRYDWSHKKINYHFSQISNMLSKI